MSKRHTSGLACLATLAILASSGVAHAADPAGTTTRYGLASYPAAGQSNAGKYAAAWADVYTNNCSNTGTVPLCFEAKAAMSGRVLNATVEAVSGIAHVQRNVTSQDDWWDWNYSAKVFGTTIVNEWGFKRTAAAVMNALEGQPLITHDSPFATRGVKNLYLDLSVISSWLEPLPDAKITINYSLNGSLSTQLDFMPLSGYGPIAGLRVQPRAGMTASGTTTYTVGPVRAKVYTPENIQVIAPNSDVNFNAAYSFVLNKATVTAAPNVRLLKGRVRYTVDGWLDPAGALVDTATAIGCGFGLFCDGTSAAWVQVDSGNVWSNTNSYVVTMQSPATPTTLFSGVLSSRPALTL